MRWPILGALAGLLLGVSGCGGEDSAGAAQSGCADGPVVTYDNFGASFLAENCQACHASGTPNRHDAPVDVAFDTREQAHAFASRILARATGDAPTMPPGGGVSDEDRALAKRWLECYPP